MIHNSSMVKSNTGNGFTVYGYQEKDNPSKWYIGKTTRHISKRDRQHKYGGAGIIFDNFLKKHPYRFSLHILKNCSSEIEMNRWEMIMIAQFDSMWPNGYNFKPGGSGGSGPKSDMARLNLSMALKGKPWGENRRGAQNKKENRSTKEWINERRRKRYKEHRIAIGGCERKRTLSIKEYNKEYSNKHKEEMKEYKKKYRAEHKDEICEYQRNHRKKLREIANANHK